MSLIGTGNPIGRPAGVGTPKDGGKDYDVLETMRKRFSHVMAADAENRQSYIQNVRISSTNNQWDEEVKKRRGSNRPALTFNLLNLVVKQIIGDYRQNKMAINVLPSGGAATEDKADILAGLIRNIERDSNADEAYTNGLECSARGNIGYFRILPEYESDDVFNQKLRILPVKNPLTVYCDPAAKLVTRADAEYYLITEMISRDEFNRLYPKAEDNGWDILDVSSDDMDDWGDEKQIRLCEYFTKERVEARLVAFDNGAVIQVDNDDEIAALEQIGIKAIKERAADRINIKWRKCTGSTVLEEKVYKTKYIPIIPVLGEEVNIEGKICLRSAIYYGIDAQHSYNYERSASIERSALSAKAPWKATLKEIEMFRDQWDNANNTPAPYLLFTPDPQHNQGNGPERIEPPQPSGADMQNSQAASLDVQRTTGVFNSQIGEQTNIQSGVGLSEQQSQGQTSTFIFLDNLRSAIEHCGRVLIDWIPVVYDKERVVRTINAEDDIEMLTINQKQENMLLGVTEVLNDITIGEYDVIVTAGKAFASRRREAVEGLINWAKAFPQQAPLVADQVLENMDVPGGEVMAERIKRSLPPQVVNDPDSPEGQQAAQQAQMQQNQHQQMMQQMMQSKMQVEQGKNQASMAKSQADVIKSQAEVTKAKADTIQAIAQTHNASAEHAADVLDQGRMAPAQQAAQPQPAAPASMATPFGSRPDDIAKAHQKAAEGNQMLTALAGHLVAKNQKDEQQSQAMQQILGALVKSHQDVASHMAQQNAIAGAPVEAVRDKAGRIVGSKKVLNK